MEDEEDDPDSLMGRSGDTRLMTGAESNPDVMPPDGTPKCSLPKDNRVGGVAFVGGSSLSSGTTGVRVDTSVDEENEFLANKR